MTIFWNRFFKVKLFLRSKTELMDECTIVSSKVERFLIRFIYYKIINIIYFPLEHFILQLTEIILFCRVTF